GEIGWQALQAADHCDSEFGRHVWIFTKSFIDSWPLRIQCQVENRCKCQMNPARPRILGSDGTCLLDKSPVERRSQIDLMRKDGGAVHVVSTMNRVKSDQYGDSCSRLPSCILNFLCQSAPLLTAGDTKIAKQRLTHRGNWVIEDRTHSIFLYEIGER